LIANGRDCWQFQSAASMILRSPALLPGLPQRLLLPLPEPSGGNGGGGGGGGGGAGGCGAGGQLGGVGAVLQTGAAGGVTVGADTRAPAAA